MIDRGLLATIIGMWAVVAALDRILGRRNTGRESVLALASTPLLVGIAVARMVAVALDDPSTLRRPLDLLLIRGGMEFWPGLAAGVVAAWVSARREPVRPQERLARLTPFVLWAYGTYEAACLLRDGCFGPRMPFGLRPGGIGPPQLPVGVVVGLAAAALGIAAWRWSSAHPFWVLGTSLTLLAAIRTAAGFFLPDVTVGPTRAHRESMAVLAIGLVVGIGVAARRAFRPVRDGRPLSADGT